MSETSRPGAGSSYLVRLWYEPQDVEGGEATVRVYVRDLRSGEERYLKSVEGLAELLEQHHRARHAAVASRHQDSGSARRHAG